MQMTCPSAQPNTGSHGQFLPSTSLTLGNSIFPHPPSPVSFGQRGVGRPPVKLVWQVGCYRAPGEAGPLSRGKCCLKLLWSSKHIVSTLVNKQGLVSIPPQPQQSIKHIQLPHLLTSWFKLMSQGVHVFPWKVLGPGDDNSESINTLKVYCP